MPYVVLERLEPDRDVPLERRELPDDPELAIPAQDLLLERPLPLHPGARERAGDPRAVLVLAAAPGQQPERPKWP